MIGLVNTKGNIAKRLSEGREINIFDNLVSLDKLPELSGLFIDWVSRYEKIEFSRQATLVDHYARKGIPIIIFDRYLNLTRKEYDYLNKFNVTFFEPAIKNRVGFEYVPQWIDRDEFKFKYNETNGRDILLAYKGDIDDRIASFEKYFETYARLFPNRKVVVESKLDHLQAKIKKYRNNNIEFSELDFTNVFFTILIGSKKEYEIGYLRNDLSEIMKAGVVPLCPIEHRFFGSMFKELVIDSEAAIDYFLDFSFDIKYVLIDEILDNIELYYPEFLINYIVDRINDVL